MRTSPFQASGLLLLVVVMSTAAPTRAMPGSPELTPIDQVPRLAMFDTGVDYKRTLVGGVLAPERIELDSASVSVRQAEPALLEALGRQFVVTEAEQHRSRDQQWAYLRELAAKNDDSMHYYIIEHIYYELQLSGWFQVYEWTICDLKIRAFLVRTTEGGTPRIWLLHITPDPVPAQRVSYAKSSGLALVRAGECEVRWNVDKNTVAIGQPAAAEPVGP